MSQAATILATPTGANGSPIPVSSANPLPISGSISAVSSAVATAAAPSLVEGSTNAFSSDLSGNLRIGGTISASTSAKATTADPSYVNNTDNALSQNLAGYLRTISGNFPALVDVNSGNKSASTLRVVLATDQVQLTNALKVDPSGVTSPVSIATAPALVASSAVIGKVGIDQTTPGTTNLVQFTHGKTIKTATLSAITADTDIIAAVATKRIKVIAYAMFTTGTNASTLAFKSNGVAGTLLANVMLQSQASAIFGANLAIPAPSFLFATVAGEKLTLDVGNTDPITGFITYFDDDTT